MWGFLGIVLLWGGYSLLHKSKREVLENASEASVTAPEFTSLFSKIKEQFASYGAFAGFSEKVLHGASVLQDIRKAIPHFLAGQPTNLPDLLGSLHGAIADLDGLGAHLIAVRPDLKDHFPFFGNYLSFQTQLADSNEALAGVSEWLARPEPHHLIIILSNTSELRPGGGFIGSVADLEVARGAVTNLTVRDVNEIDRTRDKNVIPPQPLQAIVGRWRIADANWFFDYPVSARNIMEFMSESDLYATSSIDGVLTVTPKVFEDTLRITGPVSLPDGRTVSAENIVTEIQNDVQAGQANGTANPKAVLASLAPALIARLQNLPDDKQQALVKDSLAWIRSKDLMLYMNDTRIEHVLGVYGADGSLFALPQEFLGDYLAAVNANIGGAKTDRVIKETIDLASRIDDKGIVHDTVTISREHNGNERSEWWYTAENWNYLMLFTPKDATIENVSGVGRRFITPKAAYGKTWNRDSDLEAIQATIVNSEDGKLQAFEESGKNVFATWQRIPAGGQKKTVIAYARSLSRAPYDGMPYDFVFEKQSGSTAAFSLEITAPIGFEWVGDGPVYAYSNDNPPGRLVVHLILKKR